MPMGTAQDERPELVVGIDFGMTYTGVAWTNLQNFVQSIDDWPGLEDAHQVKVPTKFVAGQENKWGFLCNGIDAEESGDQVEECFKIYLDQGSIDAAERNQVEGVPGSVQEAQKLTSEYLGHIYKHVKRSIEGQTGGSWSERKVEFSFSMPTTWTAQQILNDFEKAVRDAGFGSENTLKHTVKLGLTEADAAAVYVASNRQIEFSNGDIILVCDAGGGTTDLGLIQVDDASVPKLKQVAAVAGVGIGSTMIDNAFEAMIQKRLDSHPEGLSLPINLAQKMSRSSQFQSFKHKFGSPSGDVAEYVFKLDVLGLGITQALSIPDVGIERGRMRFKKLEIQKLFDPQIRRIIAKIDEQLDLMHVHSIGNRVKYLVLSGGLGGSEYVKSRLEERYSATGLAIIVAQQPRLSVVKGLVSDRKHKIITGEAIQTSRIARASYGVICRQLYDPARHPGAEIQYDFYKKKQRWAINQIEWLIRKGDTINTSKAREKPFSKKIQPGDVSRQWNTKIVVSHNDRESLPRMMGEAGAHSLCVVQCDMKEVEEKEFELKNKRCWQGKRYFNASFTIRVITGPADLTFELWFKGQKYNRNHDPVKVEWDVGASVRPNTPKKLKEDHLDSYGELR